MLTVVVSLYYGRFAGYKLGFSKKSKNWDYIVNNVAEKKN